MRYQEVRTETFNEEEKEQLNSLESVFAYKQTWVFEKFIHCKAKVWALFCGNQSFKTSGAMYQNVLSVLGTHPVPDKNIVYFECSSRACKNGHRYLRPPSDMICQKCGGELSKFSGHLYIRSEVPKSGQCVKCNTLISEHIRGNRILRFASETLPNEKSDTGSGKEGQSAEIKNTIYPEFKKWLPKFLIKRDITFRNPSMALFDPNGGPDIIAEFTSYNQPVQAAAGVQRARIYCDEEPPIEFWNEQLPRLMAENGDIGIGLTPAIKMTWTFDEIYEKARVYYRTKTNAEIIGRPQIEKTDSPVPFVVFQASTDDNPTLDKEVVERMFANYDDPDTVLARRHGVFHQSIGRIQSDFDYATHFISPDPYFPNGMFHEWLHARMEDYHESVNLAIVWIALSPYNEAFVYNEWNPSPEKFVTAEISRRIAEMSKDYKYAMNLIDPLASKTQSNTGVSVVDDMNRMFHEYKREGICEGGYWEAWDTKSTRGRDEVRKRLKNAKRCGKPFNNVIVSDGATTHLPTLWILNNCKLTAQSLKQWRKNDKGEPEQRHSHFNMCLEAVMKDSRFRPRRTGWEKPQEPKPQFFKGRG